MSFSRIGTVWGEPYTSPQFFDARSVLLGKDEARRIETTIPKECKVKAVNRVVISTQGVEFFGDNQAFTRRQNERDELVYLTFHTLQ